LRGACAPAAAASTRSPRARTSHAASRKAPAALCPAPAGPGPPLRKRGTGLRAAPALQPPPPPQQPARTWDPGYRHISMMTLSRYTSCLPPGALPTRSSRAFSRACCCALIWKTCGVPRTSSSHTTPALHMS
jgi:hypothetical protein